MKRLSITYPKIALLAWGLLGCPVVFLGAPDSKSIPGSKPHREDFERPPKPPLLEALDLNGDVVLDAEEIAKASESLKKLDKNGDGKLTGNELHPPHPKEPPFSGGAFSPRDLEDSDVPPKPFGSGLPKPPVLEALDLNHDGVIDAKEIALAPHSLLALDKNGDGKLTEDEIRPPRPERKPRDPSGQPGKPSPGSKRPGDSTGAR